MIQTPERTIILNQPAPSVVTDTLFAPDRKKLNILRQQFTLTSEGQKTMVDWVEALRQEIGSREQWESTCQKADVELLSQPITDEVLSLIFDQLSPLIDQMSPGHDKGHLSRDFISAIVQYRENRQHVKYQSDALTGVVAGGLHDAATATFPRHEDDKGASHAEVGAYLIWQATAGILGENTRKLICYAIAAHTNSQGDFKATVPEGYTRKPYWAELWPDEEKSDKENTYIGITIEATRQADKADIWGPFQLGRNGLAQGFAWFSDPDHAGTYSIGGRKIKVDHESVRSTFYPKLVADRTDHATSIQHCRAFVGGIDKINAYNRNDQLFPEYNARLHGAAQRVMDITGLMTLPAGQLPDTGSLGLENFHKFYYQMSLSDPKDFGIFWDNFVNHIWNAMSPLDQKRWLVGLQGMQSYANEYFATAEAEIRNSPFPEFGLQILNCLRQ